jgi:hypothetical protein
MSEMMSQEELRSAYQEMAADEAREAAALERAEATGANRSDLKASEKITSTRLLDLLAGWSAYVSTDEDNGLLDPALSAEELGELYQLAGQESETWLEMSEASQEEAIRAFVAERILPLLLRGFGD